MRTAVSLGVEPVELDVRRAWVGVPLMKKVEVAIEGRDKKQLRVVTQRDCSTALLITDNR